MGYTGWSDDFYEARESRRAKTGETAFTYHEEMRKTSREERKVHKEMNPFGVFRESRDSAKHPDSLAIMVPFDHTGSMGRIPVALQKKLGRLMKLLIKNGYADHPQIFFGAIGDANFDQAPVQVGQFESGIEMDNDLGKLMLEGGGGPYGSESYELMIYFAARKTSIDCFEKRGEKGFLFLIGDEEPYDQVSASQVRKIFGDEINQSIPVEKIIAEAQEKFNIFFIVPRGASGGSNKVIFRRWTQLLGQEFVMTLDDPEMVCEAIASAIALCRGKADLNETTGDLVRYGVDEKAAISLSRALVNIADGAVTVAKSDAGLVKVQKTGHKKIVLL